MLMSVQHTAAVWLYTDTAPSLQATVIITAERVKTTPLSSALVFQQTKQKFPTLSIEVTWISTFFWMTTCKKWQPQLLEGEFFQWTTGQRVTLLQGTYVCLLRQLQGEIKTIGLGKLWEELHCTRTTLQPTSVQWLPSRNADFNSFITTLSPWLGVLRLELPLWMMKKFSCFDSE